MVELSSRRIASPPRRALTDLSQPACHLCISRSTTRPDEELVSTKDSAQVSIHDTEGGKGRLLASPAHSILCVSACSAYRDSGRVPRYQNSTRPKITVHYTPPFVVRRPREPRESNSTRPPCLKLVNPVHPLPNFSRLHPACRSDRLSSGQATR